MSFIHGDGIQDVVITGGCQILIFCVYEERSVISFLVKKVR